MNYYYQKLLIKMKIKCIILALFLHEKSDFAKILKNLAKYRSKNNFVDLKSLCRILKLLKCQNNFLLHCSSCLRFLHNYFDNKIVVQVNF